jgi:hypothetical protein
MYADDIVLLARSAKDLQTYMDVLGTFCETRQLTVNTEKTKVLVFGSRQPHPNTFKIRGDAIEQVKSYKYLGLTMHQNRSWALALAERAQSARRAVFSLRKRCGEMHISDVGTTLQLFDALVKPILSYGCELWVDSGGTAELEVIHKGFVKSLLGLNKSTGTHLVMAEVGRFLMDVFWHKMAMAYLVRLREATDLPVLQAAYHEQKQLTITNKDCWLLALNTWACKIGIDLNLEHFELAAGVLKTQNNFC